MSTNIAWWWMSFADPALPKGEQFLGASIVKANTFLLAHVETKLRRLNPGGEVKGWGLSEAVAAQIPERFKYKLLTQAEITELDTLLAVKTD